MLWTLLLSLLGLTAAVFREDVLVNDFKFAVYGFPKFISEFNNSLAVVTDENVVAVYNEFGNALWRQILQPSQTKSGVAFNGDLIVVGGEYLEGFNASNGHSIFTVDYPAKSVYTQDDQIVIDGNATVDVDGVVSNIKSALFMEPQEVHIGETALKNGNKLKLSAQGVLQLLNSTNDIVWSRDDGLSRAVNAEFLLFPVDESSTQLLSAEYLNNAYFNGENGFMGPLFKRLLHHFRDLLKFLFRFMFKSGFLEILLPKQPKPEYQFNQILVIQTDMGSLYGLNTASGGSIAWVYHDLDVLSIAPNEDRTAVHVKSGDGNVYLVNNEGEVLGISEMPENNFDSVEVNGNTIHSTKFDWSLDLPGDVVIGKAAKDTRDVTALVALPLSDNEVLYKYLNPYTSVFASYSNDSKNLALTIVCTVTGRVLGQIAHPEPVLAENFNIVFGEYWFAYSYVSLDEYKAPQITLVELYESGEVNKRVSGEHVNLKEDTLIPELKMHTWLVPHNEEVYSLAASRTRFGAAARDIVLALENTVVTIPRIDLSAIRPAPKLTIGTKNHLSHIYGVHRARHIVTAPTNLESTYLVATYGGPDLFVTKVAPSGDLDLLHKQFPKFKLIGVLGALGFAVYTLAPLSRMKILALKWR